VGEYAFPLLFLVTVFVAFGLAHRNHGGQGCHDCEDDGGCEKSTCDIARNKANSALSSRGTAHGSFK